MSGTGSAPVGPGLIVGRDKPRHHFFSEQTQYRAKLQAYSAAPPEVTVQQIDFSREVGQYLRAAELGLSQVPYRRTRTERAEPDEESLERSQRRAKTQCRKLVTELAPSALVTFTTRETMPLPALLWVWQYFGRLTRELGVSFEYVAVPERHPSNPGHLHLHAAVRGRVSITTLRRLWHIALEARHGRKVSATLRGALSPGNIDVQNIKGRDRVGRLKRIARYVSKYITKDLITAFNKRRYWPSKGIKLADAQVFWLDSLSQVDAIREACAMLGYVDGDGFTAVRPFAPSERVAWWSAYPCPS